MQPNRSLVLLNFAAIYTIWGSTYLAIKYAILEIPPLFVAGGRFLFAGLLLLLLSYLKREQSLDKPTRIRALFSGSLLVMGNAGVCVAEKYISSGMAAVIVGSVPIWVMLFNWGFFAKKRPSLFQAFGILLSVVGVVLLSSSQADDTRESLAGILSIVAAVISWSLGTLAQRQAKTEGRLLRYSGFQLAIGSFAAFSTGILTKEYVGFDITQVHALALGSFFYMAILGSAVAFSSYLWLNLWVEPAKVSTYAVVNPIVAVWLGWLFLGEVINLQVILCTAMILAGIAIVVFVKQKPALDGALAGAGAVKGSLSS